MVAVIVVANVNNAGVALVAVVVVSVGIVLSAVIAVSAGLLLLVLLSHALLFLWFVFSLLLLLPLS